MTKPLDILTVTATIRDFPINHPDFERDAFTGEVTGLEPRRSDGQEPDPRPEAGIVQAELGQDGKPNYNNGPENQRLTTTGEDNFDQWFGRSPGNYKAVPYPLDFVYDNGQYKFEAKPFFPLDRYLNSDDTFGSFYSQMFNPDGSLTAMGVEVIDRNMRDHGTNQAFLTHSNGTPLTREELIRIYSEWNREGNGELKSRMHNYGFTMEAETAFTYRGDEFFRFEGDDDLWIFIDNLLVIDLGGLHRTASRTLDLQLSDGQDTLVRNLRQDFGIVQADDRLNLVLKKGMTYNLKIFYAERHTFDSNCCFYTSLYLTSQPVEIQPPVVAPEQPEPIASPFPEELIAQPFAALREVRIDAVQDAIEPSYPLSGLPGRFQIRISEPAPAGGVRVRYEIVQDHHKSATYNADYTLSPAQEVLIPEGHQTAEVTVMPKDDRARDSGEGVSLRVVEDTQSGYVATKAQDTVHIRDAFAFGPADRIVCVAPIRTIIRREEEITIVRRVRKVEEVDVSATCPVNTTQF
ncbi:fibro-slime domain-containing protein [Leptolyngbya ohadii]|uniref:fibro-slime domain-containing protein n=1 Tax=Leptolyngbya ohadii TaxID=1962290 RepID=UPI000B59A92A|nr:fibro-slime domain-containing protein [Leptolyngbya ohadii]